MKLEDYEHLLRPGILAFHKVFSYYEILCNLTYTFLSYCLFYIGLKKKPQTHLNPKNHPAVLLTGGTSGIGRNTVIDLATRGYIVFATFRDKMAADSLLEEFHQITLRKGEIVPVELDVLKEGSIDRCYREVKEILDARGKQLSVLINNAGYCSMSAMEVTSKEDFNLQFRMACDSYIDVCKAFIPLLKESKGRIVNVTSVGGFMVTPGFGAYCAAKAAMRQITFALKMELSRYDITVCSVEPGFTTAKSIYNNPMNAYRQFFEDKMATGVHCTDPGQTIHADSFGGQSDSYLRDTIEDNRQLINDWFTVSRVVRLIGEPTENVSKNILHAVSSPYCKPSYIVGWDARFLDWQKRYLPEDLHEWTLGLIFPFVRGAIDKNQNETEKRNLKILDEFEKQKGERKEPLEDLSKKNFKEKSGETLRERSKEKAKKSPGTSDSQIGRSITSAVPVY